MVLKIDGIDIDKVIVERRYFDFVVFFKVFKKDYFKLVDNVSFFGKVFGKKSNLNFEVIEFRGYVFENFLENIYRYKEVCVY